MPPRKKGTTDKNEEALTPEDSSEETTGSKSSTKKSTRSSSRKSSSKTETSQASPEESSSIVEPVADKKADKEPSGPEPESEKPASIVAPSAEGATAETSASEKRPPVYEPGPDREPRPDPGMPVPEPIATEPPAAPPFDPATLPTAPRYDVTLLTDDDLFIFNEGNHFRLYEKFGAHPMEVDGVQGTYFSVWAPNAEFVSVIGDFNYWERGSHPLQARSSSGIWEGFIPNLTKGQIYKYYIASRFGGYSAEKTDPFGYLQEVPPKTASVVWDLEYTWNDDEWMKTRSKHNSLHGPISIYEMHIGSWMRVPEEENRSLTYREMAEKLPAYLKQLGFTHVEFLPITEHPFGGSWGYQTTGYFAPTSRFGTPQDFMYLVDKLHQHEIGVILDWVPSHFPSDGHGLGYFDGTHLYEHFYPQKGWHPDWNSYIFNYGRHEVRAFLISSALFWLDKYHIDGLRVDAVASMLYLDYSRKEGEWMPNEYGSNENIEAIWFLRRFNEEVYKNYPDVQTIAEESTSWSMVSRPTYIGGLGFGLKWDMGWMHDTLSYMSRDSIYRKYHHNELSFRMLYAFHENFVLPLSHDEVVHGKRALIDKMPGDMWQQNANLRSLFGYMFAQAAKKLIFMGGEFGQWKEWMNESSLDWHLLQWADHKGMQQWVSDLNHFYCSEPAMYELDLDPSGFEWIDIHDWQNSTVSLLRRGKTTNTMVGIVCNFTPVPRANYRMGVPYGGFWREVLNSDSSIYAGSGLGNSGGVMAEPIEAQGRPYSINIILPPLSSLYFINPGPPKEEVEAEVEAEAKAEDEGTKA